MSTALITGGSGFIGGHLAETLVQRGVKVRCLVRRPQACTLLRQVGAQLIVGDVTEPASLHDAIAGVDVVYHLAGLTSSFRVDDLTHVNQGGATNVARACAAQKRPPVHVLISSIAAAGPIARGQVRVESDPAAPISNYGRSKRLGELAVEEFAHLVPTTIVRPGIVFGERNREMLPMFRVIERTGIHPHPGFASPPLSLIYVHDLVEIMLRAAARGARVPGDGSSGSQSGQGYYFASADEFPTYSELGSMIARSLGRSRVMVLPLVGPLPWVAAAVNETISRLRGISDSFNIDKIREATAPSWACSPKLSEHDLGYAPSQTLEEQLTATAVWYRENNWIGQRPVVTALKKAIQVFQPLTPISTTFEQHHQAGSSSR